MRKSILLSAVTLTFVFGGAAVAGPKPGQNQPKPSIKVAPVVAKPFVHNGQGHPRVVHNHSHGHHSSVFAPNVHGHHHHHNHHHHNFQWHGYPWFGHGWQPHYPVYYLPYFGFGW